MLAVATASAAVADAPYLRIRKVVASGPEASSMSANQPAGTTARTAATTAAIPAPAASPNRGFMPPAWTSRRTASIPRSGRPDAAHLLGEVLAKLGVGRVGPGGNAAQHAEQQRAEHGVGGVSGVVDPDRAGGMAFDTPIIDAFGIDRDAMPIRPQPVQAAVREARRDVRCRPVCREVWSASRIATLQCVGTRFAAMWFGTDILVARTFDEARLPAWRNRLDAVRRRLQRHPEPENPR
jgi:hypothetical protein